jgi:hypothetical protein
LARKVITYVLAGSLLNLALASPLHARVSAAYRNYSTRNAIIAAAIAGGALFGALVLPGLIIGDRGPKLEARPGHLNFRSATSEQTVTLRVKGDGALVVTSVSVSGDCFSLARSPQVPLTLSSKEMTQVVVGFTAKPGGCSGRLEVETKGGKKGVGMLLVPLQGRGQR